MVRHEQYLRAFDTLAITTVNGGRRRFALPAWIHERLTPEDRQQWVSRFEETSQAWHLALDVLCDRLHLVTVNPWWSTIKPQWHVAIETTESEGSSVIAVSLTNLETAEHYTVSDASETYSVPENASTEVAAMLIATHVAVSSISRQTV